MGGSSGAGMVASIIGCLLAYLIAVALNAVLNIPGICKWHVIDFHSSTFNNCCTICRS